MAKYSPPVKITDRFEMQSYPSGWRGIRLMWLFRLLKWWPHFSQSTVHFWLEIAYGNKAIHDDKEFEIRYNGSGKLDRLLKAVHDEEIDKELAGNIFIKEFTLELKHDGEPLEFFIKFPNTGRIARLVWSAPIPHNWLFLLVIGAIVGALVGSLVTLIFS